jgi:DHA1 family bicyclomycin/chloramphenicol resistance-like MFS transporter
MSAPGSASSEANTSATRERLGLGPFFVPALASISLVGPLAVHLYMPAIPAAKAALHLSEAQAQFLFSIALFIMSFATLGYGALSDRLGRRPLLLSGLSFFVVGSVIAFAAESTTLLVAGRALQALGAGCGVTLVRTIAADVYGAAGLVKAIAFLTMAYTIGPMISPMMGGILIDAFGWRSVFGFALLMGSVLLVSTFLAVPETRPKDRPPQTGIFRSYWSLLSQLRFTPFVLQSGFSTGTFLVTATAASTFMKDVLERPSTEFGLYFLMFPFGFLFGNFISTRLSGKVANETMVLVGSTLALLTVVTQSSLLWAGHLSPLVLFAPGFFMTTAQGLSLPFGQAAAISVNPRLAGMAAGIGVFMQHFCGAAFAQLYGFVSDGTPGPLIATTALTASLMFIAGATPFCLSIARRPR